MCLLMLFVKKGKRFWCFLALLKYRRTKVKIL